MRPPHDIQAEQAVLATLALKRSLADDIRSRLPEPDCFFDSRHQALYPALLNLAGRNEDADPVTVAAELHRLGELRRFKGRQHVEEYVLEICRRVPGTRNYEAYARIVQRAWVLRRIQRSNAEISDLAGVPETEVTALLLQMQKESVGLLGLADFRPTRRFGDVAEDVLEDAMERQAEAARLGEGGQLGLPSGVPGLSELVGGFRPATFVVAGGAPGWGKSTLMMQMADHIADTAAGRSEAGGSHVVSIEMSADQLVSKTLLGNAGVDSRRIDAGTASDEELSRVYAALERLRNRRVLIDDLDDPTWPQVRAKIILAKEEHNIECAFIDYVQKIRKPPRMERKDHVAEIAAGCKSLAKQLDICIVGMAQLKRPEGRRRNATPPKPQMTDLADSASLERDADMVLLLWPRDAVAPDFRRDGDWARQHTTLVVAKNRFGNTGEVPVIFNKSLQLFEPPPEHAEMNWSAAPNYTERESAPVPNSQEIIP